MSQQGYSAYQQAQNSTQDPRDVEYRLLANVTHALKQASENPNDVKQRVDAVLWNRDVWAAFRLDLMSDQNQLPDELRASLISISIWVQKESMEAMEGEGDIDALIDVNRNIMAGLKPEASANEAIDSASGVREETPLPETGEEDNTTKED